MESIDNYKILYSVRIDRVANGFILTDFDSTVIYSDYTADDKIEFITELLTSVGMSYEAIHSNRDKILIKINDI